MYFYVKNLQGDIINIVDTNGSVVVRYNYDIFGAITAVKNGSNQTITDTTSLAFLNPLRYRGYVYDDETGLYYLQSRYYDPVTGRFLNADIYVDTDSGSPLSTNMFAYCENNTNSRADYNGNWYYTLSEYARYRDDRYRIYKMFDAYSYMNNWYRQISAAYGNEYALAKNRYKWISAHYQTNLKKVSRFNTYIFGQANYPYSGFQFGASTVSRDGCGAVALFNVLYRLGYTTHLAQIILEMELNMMMKNNGASGTLNSAYPDFLRAHNIN